MTKVKTILREFCSAKDILAINRLGLLSKTDERESQPVPWRHRLHREERKELVRSEMRSQLRSADKMSKRDKIRAVTAARSPHTSRMGDYLIQQYLVNSKNSRTPSGDVSRLTGEKKRSEANMYQERHNFLRQSHCLNSEPLILVERPPSPKVKTRAKMIAKHGIDPQVVSLPSYMRPLKTKSRTPNTLTTIEAYTLQTRKKKNVWEEVAESKDEVKFKSMARPSVPLTAGERRQLKQGYNLHKPTQSTIGQSKLPSNRKQPGRQGETIHMTRSMLEGRRPSPVTSPVLPVFVTQMGKF